MTNPLKPKRLEHILASFQKTLDELQSLQDRNLSSETANSGRIHVLQQENQALSAERSRARSIHGKLTELLS